MNFRKAYRERQRKVMFADRWRFWVEHQKVVDGEIGKSADQVLCEWLRSIGIKNIEEEV